jgi:hypothetical protein
MMEEDEYDQDSVYESHVSESYENDINIKSECPDFEEDYEEQYYDEEESRKLYTFRRNETMSMDVVLADNNRAQCVQNNHSHDIAIPHVINFIF